MQFSVEQEHGASRGQFPGVKPTSGVRQAKGTNREADTQRAKGV